jgi:hypothetical protein
MIEFGENVNILGIWNVSAREQNDGYIVRNFGLGKINERDEKLKQFLLVLANILFKNHKQRRYI